MQHMTRGAFVPPPSSPKALWDETKHRTCTMVEPAGVRSGFLRLMRRHYLVVVVSGVVTTVRLPDNPAEAFLIWMSTVYTTIYPTDRLPLEFQPIIQALRPPSVSRRA